MEQKPAAGGSAWREFRFEEPGSLKLGAVAAYVAFRHGQAFGKFCIRRVAVAVLHAVGRDYGPEQARTWCKILAASDHQGDSKLGAESGEVPPLTTA